MQIVGDTAADFFTGQLDGLDVHLVPLLFSLAQVYSLGQPKIRKSAKGTASIASCWNC